MKFKATPAALSQIDYLTKKLDALEEKIKEEEKKQKKQSEIVRELYFQKGKLYSELELMKRVPSY